MGAWDTDLICREWLPLAIWQNVRGPHPYTRPTHVLSTGRYAAFIAIFFSAFRASAVYRRLN